MIIELDGIALSDTRVDATGGILGGQSVWNINVVDERNLVKHEVPGMEGSVFQDMGRTAVKITFDGLILGVNAKSIVERIRSKFKGGEPVPFLSDLSGMADVSRVVIAAFLGGEIAGTVDQYEYSIELKEFKEQPAVPSTPAAAPGAGGEEPGESQEGEGAAVEGSEAGAKEEKEEAVADEDAKDWADKEAEKSSEGSNTVVGKVVDAEGNPMKGATVNVSTDSGEHMAVTDDEGIYRLENLEPGEYIATVSEDKDFEGIKEKLTVGSGESEGE